MLAVERFADVAFKVRMLAVTRFPEAMLAVERLAEAAFSVTMFAYPSIFAFPLKKILEVLKLLDTVKFVKSPTEVMLGWEGFVTLEATLAAATFPTRLDEFRFERPEAFPIIRPPFKIPVTVRATMFAVVMTLMFEQSKLDTAPFAALRNPVFDVLVLRRLKKAVLAPRPPVTFAFTNHPVAMLAVPETLRFTRVPREVIFDWVFESWREVRGFTRFEELRFESPDAFPVYN